MTMLRSIISVSLVLVFGAAALGNTIVLRSAAKLDSAGVVTLADVAELSGDAAVAAGGVVVEADVAAAARGRMWAEITIEQVNKALRDAGVPMGRLAVSGSKCYVRFGAPPPQPEGEREPKKLMSTAQVIDFSGDETVRHRVGLALARVFAVDPTAMRVKFDAKDEAVLSTLVAGRRVAVEPMTSGLTAKALVTVRVYEGDTLAVNQTISATIELQRRVLVLTKDVARGRTITPDLLKEEDQWLEPGGATLITSADQVAACEALTRIDAGVALREHDAAPAVVIKRGDMVEVLCLSGGIEIKARARAMSDGRRGERVELRMEGSKKTFAGRADGPGRVVVALDGALAQGI